MRLKSHESPRNQGRNDKGRGGSARAKQLRKREKTLRKKLKGNGGQDSTKSKPKDGTLRIVFFF